MAEDEEEREGIWPSVAAVVVGDNIIPVDWESECESRLVVALVEIGGKMLDIEVAATLSCSGGWLVFL
ncbi:MAG TPA: hypothetical protein EYO33_02625, partial [Phycisphaerales bacterium]|nr:hypothetical protein [Phycisphaerales bacterium]